MELYNWLTVPNKIMKSWKRSWTFLKIMRDSGSNCSGKACQTNGISRGPLWKKFTNTYQTWQLHTSWKYRKPGWHQRSWLSLELTSDLGNNELAHWGGEEIYGSTENIYHRLESNLGSPEKWTIHRSPFRLDHRPSATATEIGNLTNVLTSGTVFHHSENYTTCCSTCQYYSRLETTI